MSYRIPFRVVKAIKCYLFCNTEYRSSILFEYFGNTERNFERYCTVRIFGVKSVEITRFR